MGILSLNARKMQGRKGQKIVSTLLLSAMMMSSLSIAFANVNVVSAREEKDVQEYLELQYRFDNEKNLGEDATGSGKNGTFTGAVSSAEGRNNNGIFFDSSNHGNNDAYGEMPVDAVKHNAITMMAWVKNDMTTVGSYARIFAIETGDGRCLHLMANVGSAGSGYTAELYTSSSSKTMVMTEGMVPNRVYADWHHVALTYDGAEVRIYINGAFINSAKASANLESWNIGKVYLGKTGIWGDGSYNGYMDDVRVYSTALTEEEIVHAGGIADDAALSVVKLLGSLQIDGTVPTEFNGFAEDYYHVLPDGTTRVPEVTAVPPCEGATVEVIPAESVPGTTEIKVTYPSGAIRTVTVKFVAVEDVLVHPEIKDVTIDDPFWNKKLKFFCEVTAPYVVKSWVANTHDNLRNFDKVAAGHRNTKDYVGSMTWGESDFYAAMAGACRLLQHYPNSALRGVIDNCVDHIFAASESVENGYFSIYNLLMTNGKVFSETDRASAAMDLFCLGYLMEFGIAYYETTGDARMLRVALRFLNFTVDYSNHGEKNFISFHTGVEYNLLALAEYLEKNPGVLNHELLKDLDCDVDDYWELAYHFISYRGVHTNRVNNAIFGSYAIDLLPYQQTRMADGHAVEAVLYYLSLAEHGRLTGDLSTTSAAYRLWENIVNKQMYITGAVGSQYFDEGFGGDYHLPNYAYAESCTSGGMIQYSDSLSLMFTDSRYHDVVETALYNNLLGSIGQNGTTFFYTNPLEANSSSRYTWHPVPCCTKYGLLIFGDLPRYLYSYSDTDIYINQYIGNTATLKLAGGTVTLKQTANWAEEGVASLTITGGAAHLDALYLRLPEWSETMTILLNGETVSYETVNGYAVIRGDFKDGDTVSMTADMTVKRVYADEHLTNNIGRVAIQKGPFIYCMEGVDNPSTASGPAMNWMVLPSDSTFAEKKIENLYGGVTALTTQAALLTSETTTEPYHLTLIPFYARSNRGASSVNVWLAEDPSLIDSYPLSFDGMTELKELGAKYTASTNAVDPQGGGSRDISVIVDGVKLYGTDKQQYDTYRATLTDSLGKKQNTEWYAVRFEKDYGVTHVVFWEGGHWADGGWFGDAPSIQVMVNKKWVDVRYTLTPDYPGDSQNEQLPNNEPYLFALEEPVVCSGIRVIGKRNTASGGHTSCAEIEVFGMRAEDLPSDAETENGTTNETQGDITPDNGDEKPVGLSNGMKAFVIAAAGIASMAVTCVVMKLIGKKKENL